MKCSSRVRKTSPPPSQQSGSRKSKTNTGATATTKLIPADEPSRCPRIKREDGPGRLPVRGQPVPVSGSNRIPRQVDIPVVKKTSRSQCAPPVTITEIESIPNSSSTSLGSSSNKVDQEGNDALATNINTRRSSQCLVRCRSSTSSISATRLMEGNGQSLMEPFLDTDSVFSGATNVSENITMIVPQNYASYAVTSSDNNNGDHFHQSRNKLRSNDSVQVQDEGTGGGRIIPVSLAQCLVQHALSYCTLASLPYIILGTLIFLFLFPVTTIVTGLAFCYVAFQFLGFGGSPSSKRVSRRTVKWTIVDFSEEIRNGFLTCPPFMDRSGQWRLVISQNLVMEGLQTSLGLLVTDVPKDVQIVNAKIKFSCTNSWGVELAPGMTQMKLQHRFERSGDLGYTKPMMFSQRLLGPEDTINIICRVDFQSVTIGYWKLFKRWLGVDAPVRPNAVRLEVGSIQQETLTYQDSSPSSKMMPLTRFVQHPDTKTFAWEIPNFNMVLKSKELWAICSPQFFAQSEDFCSVWRMKLIEVSGVFRVHLQLRGLPKTHESLRLWYILQLVDNFGDSVVPEHSVSRVKYPDHLNLWETSRHILYRRETLLSRFIGMDGSLKLRLSLQVQANDVPLMEADSDMWITQ